MKILITGATGLVGTEILNLCTQHHFFVHYLTTTKAKIKKTTTAQGFYWNPLTQEVDSNCLKGVDAIINLAGATIGKRWTTAYKKEIIESRVQSVKLLYTLLSENKHQVKNIVSASAIGVYPSSFSTIYKESSSLVATSFLGKVVCAWETEIEHLSKLNIAICTLRIGIVLSKKGGALQKIAQPIRLGLGAVLGNGEQLQSWIHLKDLVRLFLFALEKNLQGVYNAVASEAVTNAKMTKAIALQLKKPLWLPKIPAFVVKLLLGEMADLVLESQQVSNDTILETGFLFEYEKLEEALKISL